MRRRRILVLAVLLTAMLSEMQPTSALRSRTPPPAVHVSVSDNLFDPSPVSATIGQTVVFDVVGSFHHTVNDASGMGLYASGSVGPGDPSFEVTYPAAGGYLFTCIPHPWMGGRVTIPMRVHRLDVAPRPTFRVGWAASEAATGFVYDVQIRRPGRRWTDWQIGVTGRSIAFSPAAGPGTYRVRARMRALAGGQALWSPTAQLRVG